MNAVKIEAKGVIDKSFYNALRLIEVYCFAKKKQSKLDFLKDSQFALMELSSQLAGAVDVEKPIFTEIKQAFDYGRYLDSSYCIAKAHVFDQAVESKNQALHLRNGYLQDNMVHGYFPSNSDTRVYIKNHNFDQMLLQELSLVS